MSSLHDYLARRCIFAQLQDFVQKDLREVIRRAVNKKQVLVYYPARARSARAQRACALRALGLLLADGAPTVGGGKTF